ncbi:MAG: tetratricopeptide repeat protein, partial [Rhodospirillales bacterium]|nr:tetratricopeptide repeat protein [Rhodospirillales bacterium]
MNNISQFSRAVGAGRSGALPDKLATAAACHDAGQLQQAESLYRDILSKDPACASARHRLGVLAFQTGQLEAALKLIDSAAVLEPENAVFHMSLGAILRSQGRLQEAEAACRKSVVLDPKNPDAHNNMGNVLKDLADLDGALAAYGSVLSLHPGHVMASLNLAALHRERNDVDLAFDILADIEPLAGETAAFRNEMGLTHLRAFQPADAAPMFKAALSADPRNVSYLNNLGLA